MEEIQRKLDRDPGLFLVAEEDGRVIGTGIGGFYGRSGVIYHLAVGPEMRSRGIARALMEQVETSLRNLGWMKACPLMIPDNLVDAFYLKSGCSEMDVRIFSKTFGET
jgi:N-acetylglutamate synthase-like GNAT family acetyltransferase